MTGLRSGGQNDFEVKRAVFQITNGQVADSYAEATEYRKARAWKNSHFCVVEQPFVKEQMSSGFAESKRGGTKNLAPAESVLE
jgi:hypothetical protein